MENLYTISFLLTCLFNFHQVSQAIGVNYGLLGNDLPALSDVIATLKSRNVLKTRIFSPDQGVLSALRGSGVSVIIGTFNQDLQPLASDYANAVKWVEANVVPYIDSINIACISAGNEVIPGPLADYVPDAMQNLADALKERQLSNIKVSTAVHMGVLQSSYPPSSGLFSSESTPVMERVVQFLVDSSGPLLLNVYPYFPRSGDPANVPLDYALFQDTAEPVIDGGLTYHNLFDAMVDAVYSATEKVVVGGLGRNVEIVVSETGWPSGGGGTDASVENAATYVNNLIGHVSSGQGTPKRPGKEVEAYVFAMFNENLKPVGVERNWGLYYPNLTEVYHANLEGTS